MSLPLWLTFSKRRILISVVLKGLSILAVVFVRVSCENPPGGLWKVAVGEVYTLICCGTDIFANCVERAISFSCVAMIVDFLYVLLIVSESVSARSFLCLLDGWRQVRRMLTLNPAKHGASSLTLRIHRSPIRDPHNNSSNFHLTI